jgi:acetolactate synthase-1/2/3 large subunit
LKNKSNLIKVSDAIARVLAFYDLNTVFSVSGGASLHLLESITNLPQLNLLNNHHEQSSAFAADAFARILRRPGVAISTSGPGATNMLTGIAGCYFDSIPCLFITGQVSTNRQSEGTGVRQIGFQETNIVDMVKSITKYAVKISDKEQVVPEIIKCINLSFEGRPGPVLFDIPDDIQREYIYFNSDILPDIFNEIKESSKKIDIEYISKVISESKRPVVVVGAGIRIAGVQKLIYDFICNSNIPTVLTWGMVDLLEHDNPLRIGTFGTHGNRSSNKIIQSADLIISIGSRLDLKATGSPPSSFAPNAKIVMFDVDPAELAKFKDRDFFGVECDLRSLEFRNCVLALGKDKFTNTEWFKTIHKTKSSDTEIRTPVQQKFVEPYRFIECLSLQILNDSNIFVDTGCSVAWVMQNWKVKSGQNIFHDCNNTAMGWALPATIAGSYVNSNRLNIAIVGDGSFMMSMQEIYNISRNKSNIKIFLLNNNGYSMIKQTQDQWFKSNYFSSDGNKDLNFPNFKLLANSAQIEHFLLDNEMNMTGKLKSFMSDPRPGICEVLISPNERVVPQVKFGNPIHVMDP